MWKSLHKIMFGILVFSAGINAESLKTLKSFSADFTQMLYSSEKEHQKPIVYKGKIEALAPSSAYWNYLSPIPKEIFIQDNTMILYEPKLKQAIITRLQENMNLLSLLKNATKINQNHYESVVLEQKYDLFLENGIPKRIVFYDTLDNRVEILFQNAVINGTINPNRFDFKPSAEIDIIYN